MNTLNNHQNNPAGNRATRRSHKAVTRAKAALSSLVAMLWGRFYERSYLPAAFAGYNFDRAAMTKADRAEAASKDVEIVPCNIPGDGDDIGDDIWWESRTPA